ncbi:response regulator [Rubricoccus marinus]|uniref:DNA-binding response regulator n=1 Tax=Rubricoccus marinus TaxID=716817 RepID=A0A259U0X6_9BACT|nr:response regulator transcription factor [Rubricoccus marinus]OZC03675.1 DNA-binding response regulator [Rubricoccus marinus]
MIRVSIADDHAVVRRGLAEILRQTDDIEVLAETADGDALLDSLRERSPDVVVMDLRMPGPSGLDLVKHLRAEFPQLKVLVLSANPEDQYAVRIVRAGASGYLTKESAEAELVSAVRRVAGGKKFLTPGMAEALLDQLDSDPDEAPHAQLSDREFQVMRLIASGLPVSAVAEKLSLSVKTISTYRTRLLQKMGMANNAEITRYAIEQDLVD